MYICYIDTYKYINKHIYIYACMYVSLDPYRPPTVPGFHVRARFRSGQAPFKRCRASTVEGQTVLGPDLQIAALGPVSGMRAG